MTLMQAQHDAANCATTREQAVTAQRNDGIRQALRHLRDGDKATALRVLLLSVWAQAHLEGLQ